MEHEVGVAGRARKRGRAFGRALRRNRVTGIPLEVQRRYTEDRGGQLAAMITYNAFLSVFPLLLLSFSLVGFVLTDDAERARWVARIASSVPGLSAVIGENLDALTRHRAAAGVIGLLSLAWTGSNVVRAAGSAMNTIFEVPPHGGLRSLVWALSTLGALGALTAASVGAAAVLGASADGNPVMIALALVVGLAMDVALFTVAYRLLSHRQGPRFRALWPGALLAAIGWTLLKSIGVWYATRTVANASAVYGTFAATVGLLVVLSLGARVFLYGAVLDAVLVERKRGVSEQKAISLSRHREKRRRVNG